MTDFHTRIWELHKDWCYGNPAILYGLIRSMMPQVVVEVGTYRGFSASWMAQALKENGSGHLYCIDNFSLTDHETTCGDARTFLEENLRILGVREHITILDGDSDKVKWPKTVDFAYIDGWHGYLAAKHDFLQCSIRGAECICLDDTVQSVGPRMLTHEIRQRNDFDVIDVLRDCGMTICMRKREKGPITFSQENPDHPGIDLQAVSREYQLRHFEEQSNRNGVQYSPIYHLLCEGRKDE